MKHISIVLVDTDTAPHRVKISHGKKNFLTENDTESDIVAKDINTLATGLIMAIRHGGDKGLLNKYETLENLITYLKKNLSFIDTDGLSADGFEEMGGSILRK